MEVTLQGDLVIDLETALELIEIETAMEKDEATADANEISQD